ncbi:MAG TPA: HAD-IA family hydrolase [Ornithinimicrobium sp.]|uniref:HAD family hydrolase n=1 Tax=Ornithinimicrobium sp. TaxID=1977084 RepID=UPI002B4600E2|nr:HAD-IA family hydrolase [Ornithinimicrobium sp.]HKJ13008.1 HAD-IA family hydrolase [Ornithinimicrobium sp.]
MLRWPVVLFDLDGTLADTIDLIVASYRHALRAVLCADLPEPQLRSWIGRPLRATVAETFPDRVDDVEEVVRVYREWNLAHHDEMIREFPGVRRLLADLEGSGARLGVVTAKIAQTADLGLRATGLHRRIPVLAGAEATDRHKPDPDPLLHAASTLQVDPSDCVYVGDSVHDLRAARAAGMSAVGVTWGAGLRHELEAEQPVAVVDDTIELSTLLRAG